MRVLGINGSPHPNGNTAFALDYALDMLTAGGMETESILLAGKTVNPCTGCFQCRTEECRFDDDMGVILDAMRRADCILLASPVYLGMVSGQMKVMMDRTVLLRSRRQFELSGKVGAGIACGGFRNGGQELTLQCMHTFFLQQDMQVISDGPPYSHSGAAIVGDAENDDVGLQTIANIVVRMSAFS